jgi:hypothetical protein
MKITHLKHLLRTKKKRVVILENIVGDSLQKTSDLVDWNNSFNADWALWYPSVNTNVGSFLSCFIVFSVKTVIIIKNNKNLFSHTCSVCVQNVVYHT